MAHDFASLTFRVWRNALNGLELRMCKSLLNVAQLPKPVNATLPVRLGAFSVFVAVGQGKSGLYRCFGEVIIRGIISLIALRGKIRVR
jgi:hypothetical protein